MTILRIAALCCLMLCSMAGAIGFEHFNPPPYPPQDPMPMPMPYPSAPPYPSRINNCSIPAGVYRADVSHRSFGEGLTVSSAKLYIHVNEAGMLVMRFMLKPSFGQHENYLVIPYGIQADLQVICNGNQFSFGFSRIASGKKTLSGNLSGTYYPRQGIIVEGLMERYDRNWSSTATISLDNMALPLVHNYAVP